MRWKDRIASMSPERYEAHLASERQRDKQRQRRPAHKVRKAEEQRTTRQRIRDRNHRFVYEYLLTHPCVDCGERDPIVLEFDHLDRKLKDAPVSAFASSTYSLARIEREMKKCVVVCANCHKRRTRLQLGWTARTAA